MRKLFVALLSAPVRFYRAVVSPLMPPACRFEPSCSVYALEALKVHGPVKGLWLTARRLSRCHPISWLGGSSGFDPVPHPKH
jgi:putative membrane protein insertion efficiency factor